MGGEGEAGREEIEKGQKEKRGRKRKRKREEGEEGRKRRRKGRSHIPSQDSHHQRLLYPDAVQLLLDCLKR